MSLINSTAHKLVDILVHNADASTVPNLLLSWIRDTILPTTSSSSSNSPRPSLFSILTLPAPIDYCEPNYSFSPYCAEFFNTVTNLSFILFALYAFTQCRRFRLPPRFYLLATALLLTGINSAVYHATLTWVGLKADEVSENVVFITLIHMHRHWLVTALHALLAGVGVLFVHWMLFCELHIVAISAVTIAHYVGVMRRVPEISAAFWKGLALSVAGEACWVVDHLACETLSRRWQLHGWWHVLMGCCIHQLFVVAVIAYAPGGRLEALNNGDEALQEIVMEQRYGLDWLQAAPVKRKHA